MKHTAFNDNFNLNGAATYLWSRMQEIFDQYKYFLGKCIIYHIDIFYEKQFKRFKWWSKLLKSVLHFITGIAAISQELLQV